MTNAEIILESIRRFESGEHVAMSELFSADFTAFVPGVEPLQKPAFLTLCAALIEAKGDTVKILLAPMGTHTGTLHFPGITPVKPTGVSIALPHHLFEYTIVKGLIIKTVVEDASSGGLYGLLQQLGVSLSENGREE
jgi:hypothetical protein